MSQDPPKRTEVAPHVGGQPPSETAEPSFADTLNALGRYLVDTWTANETTRAYEETLRLRSREGPRQLADRLLAQPQLSEFDRNITALRREVEERAQALLVEKKSGPQKEEQIRELERALEELRDRQQLATLLSRLGEAGQSHLLRSNDFRNNFSADIAHPSYVVSIDIRRSSELMLKARDAKAFATFITTVAVEMRRIVIENYGVFDKFTGDGIQCLFPEFFSGPDAGFFALKVASDCHRVFGDIYDGNRSTFVSILKGAGLGIGIDFGMVSLVQVGSDFTTVGTPVVYAGRMAGANAGLTLVNQPAFERLMAQYSELCDFAETEIEIKHEGSILAYGVSLNNKPFTPLMPNWTIR